MHITFIDIHRKMVGCTKVRKTITMILLYFSIIHEKISYNDVFLNIPVDHKRTKYLFQIFKMFKYETLKLLK